VIVHEPTKDWALPDDHDIYQDIKMARVAQNLETPVDERIKYATWPETVAYLSTASMDSRYANREFKEAYQHAFREYLDRWTPLDPDEQPPPLDEDPELGPGAIDQVVSTDELRTARSVVADVHVDDSIKEYVLDLVAATRDDPNVEYGASPRAALAFLDTAKARAAINGREYVIPDDVKALIEPILIHRLVLSADASLGDVSVEEVLADISNSVEPPGSDGSATISPALHDSGDLSEDE